MGARPKLLIVRCQFLPVPVPDRGASYNPKTCPLRQTAPPCVTSPAKPGAPRVGSTSMGMTLPLFDTPDSGPQTLSPGAVLLRGWARAQAAQWVEHVQAITTKAPFRVMLRPGGAPLPVAMSNCGAYGWVSDARRYRYLATAPDTGMP